MAQSLQALRCTAQPQQLCASHAAAVDDISALPPSFKRSLKARNRSPKTIRGYVDSARRLTAFLADSGMPRAVGAIRGEHVEAFIADQLDRWTPSTAATRYRYLQQFLRWLKQEGEISASPLGSHEAAIGS